MAEAEELELEGCPSHDYSQFCGAYGGVLKSVRADGERKQIFQDNVNLIVSHNKKYQAGETSYYMGVNLFADMTQDEFEKTHFAKLDKDPKVLAPELFQPEYGDTLPAYVNWREKGYVTRVKDQGQFPSCWTFSATGSLEGQHYKANRELVSLSEQQLIDCCQSGPSGGGHMETAFQYIKDAGGIAREAVYPYKGNKAPSCGFDKRSMATPKLKVRGYVEIPTGSETQLQEAVARIGPISVAVDAGRWSFYKGGIFDDPMAGTDLNHGVVVVGYGTERGRDYWLVKNSWSDKWGENGYMKLSRNNNNHCGVATDASYPLV